MCTNIKFKWLPAIIINGKLLFDCYWMHWMCSTWHTMVSIYSIQLTIKSFLFSLCLCLFFCFPLILLLPLWRKISQINTHIVTHHTKIKMSNTNNKILLPKCTKKQQNKKPVNETYETQWTFVQSHLIKYWVIRRRWCRQWAKRFRCCCVHRM